jgi:hypothetical protein
MNATDQVLLPKLKSAFSDESFGDLAEFLLLSIEAIVQHANQQSKSVTLHPTTSSQVVRKFKNDTINKRRKKINWLMTNNE